jgi:hypothetical protein
MLPLVRHPLARTLFIFLGTLLAGCGTKTPLKTFLEMGGRASARFANPEVEFYPEKKNSGNYVVGWVRSGQGESLSFTFEGSPAAGRSYSLTPYRKTPDFEGFKAPPGAIGNFDNGKTVLTLNVSRGYIDSGTITIFQMGVKTGDAIAFEFSTELTDGQNYSGAVVTTLGETPTQPDPL